MTLQGRKVEATQEGVDGLMIGENDNTQENIERYLTLHEHHIAFLLVQRKSNKEICAQLCISVDTVRGRLKSIYSKYGIEGMDKGKRQVVANIYSEYVTKAFIEAR